MLLPDVWQTQRDQACEDLALDSDPTTVVAWLAPTNPQLRIEHHDGHDRIVASPLDAIEEPASLTKLRSVVESMLPEVEIADVPPRGSWLDRVPR